jgi:hypothetical protein
MPAIAHIPMEIVQRIPSENDVLEKVPSMTRLHRSILKAESDL